MTAPRGHRAAPHTADTIIEAWGPTLGECLEEAVLGLVEGFADVAGAVPSERADLDLLGPDPDDLLVELLEQVIYLLDVHGAVVVRASVAADRARFDTTPLAAVEVVGPEPKAVALSGLACAPDDEGTWRARATIDV
ncbi:MAG: archease [Actinobacteria bacterium]|nr:archease [Actinomycetota bacterium]